MKTTMLALAATLIAGLLPQAFAAGQTHSRKDLKHLDEAVRVLKKDGHTDLSQRLGEFAKREAGAVQDQENVGVEQNDITLLRDSADALKYRHPKLSRDLNKFADEEQREMRNAPAPKGSRHPMKTKPAGTPTNPSGTQQP